MPLSFLSSKPIVIPLPASFDKERMYAFIKKVLDEGKNVRSPKISFDFATLRFIEPIGVVALSNVIEFLRVDKNCEVKFLNIDLGLNAIKYLDDSGFFLPYARGSRLNQFSAGCRQTTCPLQIIPQHDFTRYLYRDLIPWIEGIFNLQEDSLAGLRAAIEEIFHNINDHSGTGVGCTFSQYYPKKGEVHIAIADFGQGIPEAVRKLVPAISDRDAMAKAAEEGFTTKNNVRNRGAGIPTLIRYIKGKPGSSLIIASSTTEMATSSSSIGNRPTFRNIKDGFFPGTIVRVIIAESSLRAFFVEVQEEDFEW